MRSTAGGRSTLAQVASEAELSISTVSKVLNGRDGVAADTRRRVEAALQAHGYVRRGAGSSDGSFRRVDLVLLGIDGSWPASVACGVEAAAFEAGYDLVISVARETPPVSGRPGRDWVDRVLERGTSGVVLGLVELSARQQARLDQAKVPCVVLDPLSDPPPGAASVGATNWAGAYEATTHLLGLGHRRIALLTGPADHLYTRARIAGYRSAMADAGIPVPAEFVRHGTYDRASGRRNVEALLALSPTPTALFICSDHMAIGGYEALTAAGLRVPDDMSVVGFDDLPEARWAYPPLTTVRQPLKEMANNALRMLVRLIDGEELESPRLELATTLVQRGSTAPAAAPTQRPSAAPPVLASVPGKRPRTGGDRR